MPGTNRDLRRARAGRPYVKHRAQKLAHGGPCTVCGDHVASLSEWKAQGTRCLHPHHSQEQGCPTHPLAPSLDHLVPLNQGGSKDVRHNGGRAHYGCNSSKGDGTKQQRKTTTLKPWPSGL